MLCSIIIVTVGYLTLLFILSKGCIYDPLSEKHGQLFFTTQLLLCYKFTPANS